VATDPACWAAVVVPAGSQPVHPEGIEAAATMAAARAVATAAAEAEAATVAVRGVAPVVVVVGGAVA